MEFVKISRISLPAALLGCSALATVTVAVPAAAQSQAALRGGLEEIVVTAQKREQSLQDVPIAVTAISQDTLKNNRITSVQDLNGQAPNLAMRVTAGGSGIPNFMMRGTVSYGSVAGQDKVVSMYLDGVYIGTSQGSAFELPDLERIEVLRGPQGTLFGRNSTAGAISIITREPTGEFSGMQRFTYGNYDQFESSTRINLPAWGPFSASISYSHRQRKGDMKNLGAGQAWDRTGPNTGQGIGVSPKTLGDQNVESVFTALKFEPTDNFKAVYRFDWMENDFTPEGACTVGLAPSAIGAAGNALALAYAANPSPLCPTAERPKEVNNSWSVPGYQKVSGHNLTATLRITDSLSAKNIFGYRESEIYSFTEIAGLGGMVVTPAMVAATPAFAAALGAPYEAGGSQSFATAKQWSDELQFNFDSKWVTVTAGGIYFDLRSSNGSPEGLGGTVTLSPVVGGRLFRGQRNLNYNVGKSAAGYVQVEAHVLPQLDIVGGYRLTYDKKTGTNYVASVPFTFVYEKTRPTYQVGLNYKPTPDSLIYAKYSTGYVSGGQVATIAYPPETVEAYEAGAKASFLDNRLQVSGALFKADYLNLQAVSGGAFLPVPQPALGTLVLREADLKTKGFELEMRAAPLPGLILSGALGYTKATFKNPNRFLRPVNADYPTVRSPWTLNMSVQYETDPVWNDARLLFRVDAIWRDKFRALAEDASIIPASFAPAIFSPAMWLVNARVALADINVGNTKAELALWGKNLADADNPAQPINFRFLVSSSFQRARTYGLDLTFDF